MIRNSSRNSRKRDPDCGGSGMVVRGVAGAWMRKARGGRAAAVTLAQANVTPMRLSLRQTM